MPTSRRRPEIEWHSIPGERQKYRWSESKGKHIFQDGTEVPRNLLPSRATSSRQDDRIIASRASPISVPRVSNTGAQSHATGTGTPDASLALLSLSPSPNTASPRTSQSYLKQTRAAPQTEPDVDWQSTGNIKKFTARDPGSGVQTSWQIGPSQLYADPDEPAGRSFANKKLRGRDDDSQEEERDKGDRDRSIEGYQRSTQPSADFVIGRVIEMLLVAPPTEGLSTMTRLTTNTQRPRVPGGFLTGMRRFVISRASTEEKPGFSALPIKTYNGLGVAAPGVVKSHHAIIYTRHPPQSTPNEDPRRLPNGGLEAAMRAQPILVIPYERVRPLDPMSRLDFFDVHEFDDDVDNVMLYGKVDQRSQRAFEFQYQAVWQHIRQAAAQPSGVGTVNPAAGTMIAPETARLSNLQARAQGLRVSLTHLNQVQLRDASNMAPGPQLQWLLQTLQHQDPQVYVQVLAALQQQQAQQQQQAAQIRANNDDSDEEDEDDSDDDDSDDDDDDE